MHRLLVFLVLLTGCAHFGALPLMDGSCPTSHRIKGNAESRIYHQPGTLYYDRVHAERCFKTAEDARKAGFRAPRYRR